ncbi:MAG: signal peptidase II [Planctomycetota bacterium]|jgi:signal peptidase II
MSRKSRVAWLTLAVVLAGLDLWSKGLWEYPETIDGPPVLNRTLVEGWLFIRTIYNTGGVWSIPLGRTILLLATLAAVPLLLVWIFYPERARVWETTGKALILGGAAGNLWDRIRYGAVRDFIDVYVKPFDWHYPTFNVADASLLAGIVLLLLLSFRREKKEARA